MRVCACVSKAVASYLPSVLSWPYYSLIVFPVLLPPPFVSQDLKHAFPASRLLISTITTELDDLNKAFASFKRVVEGDPNLRPWSADALTPKGSGQPPSPSCLNRAVNSGSVGGSGGAGAESDGTGESSPQSTRPEKLANLSMQKTENRKSVASSGKVRAAGFCGEVEGPLRTCEADRGILWAYY